MFSFDMLTNGVRGVGILTDTMTDEELEVHGVDWEAFQDENLLQSVDRGLSVEGEVETGSWVGQVGPPDRLNEVRLESPDSPLTNEEINVLHQAVENFMGQGSDDDIISAWVIGLATVRSFRNDLF